MEYMKAFVKSDMRQVIRTQEKGRKVVEMTRDSRWKSLQQAITKNRKLSDCTYELPVEQPKDKSQSWS